MKHRHLYSLLDNSYALARVVFDEPSRQRKPVLPREQVTAMVNDTRNAPKPWDSSAEGYQYKVPKDWNVKVDDHLVVVTPMGGLKVVQVVEVDNAAAIDPDADHDYKWAVQRVDSSEYDKLVWRENEFQTVMLEVERVRQRESTMDSFRTRLPEGSEARRMFDEVTAKLAAPVEKAS